jgi:hypothetical protein
MVWKEMKRKEEKKNKAGESKRLISDASCI